MYISAFKKYTINFNLKPNKAKENFSRYKTTITLKFKVRGDKAKKIEDWMKWT